MVKTVADIAECRVLRILGVQQDGHEGRLPVVAMEHIGDADDFRSFDHRAGK